jgi:hypothetical protein
MPFPQPRQRFFKPIFGYADAEPNVALSAAPIDLARRQRDIGLIQRLFAVMLIVAVYDTRPDVQRTRRLKCLQPYLWQDFEDSISPPLVAGIALLDP